MTPSQAKNAIRRCLREVIERALTKKQTGTIWQHFENKCAYCETSLERATRRGHMDHLVSVESEGSNHISNFVLACHSCNGDEKLSEDWLTFLQRKCESADELARRTQKIRAWLDNNAANDSAVPEEVRHAIRESFESVSKELDKQLAILRSLRASPHKTR